MTQNEVILRHLEQHGKITSIVAMHKYRIMRLASRINDLRKKGYRIESVTMRNKRKHWTEYRYEVSESIH